MTVAVHQPNYFPWLGYFYKLLKADLFVYHDAVPFSRSSYTRRSRIPIAKGSAELDWLSVPVQHVPEFTPISDIEVDDSRDWRSKHLNKICNTYASAPFFTDVYQIVQECLNQTRNETKLAWINRSIIERLCLVLEIPLATRQSSEFNLSMSGSALNLALVKELNATTYLSGTGAMQYEEVESFANANVNIQIADVMAWLNDNPYRQQSPVFNGGLSIIDALMNLGFAGTRTLLDQMLTEIPSQS